MFGLFKHPTFRDDRFGLLIRSGGHWRGTIRLGRHGEVALLLSGGRAAPDRAGLTLAHELAERFERELVPQIATGLLEHFEPYGKGIVRAEGYGAERVSGPRIARAEDVWSHASPVHVLIRPLRGSPTDGPTIEIAYTVAWDEEHTVGVRIQQWRLFELCGSV